MMMPGNDVLTEPVARRIEFFTGAGRRRTWSAEAKAKIVVESYASSVGAVAERYGLAKNQLFSWRRDARTKAAAAGALQFAPVIVEPSPTSPSVASHPKRSRRRRRAGEGGIALEIGGVAVRVERGADTEMVAAVIRALKADA
jgi:transposase